MVKILVMGDLHLSEKTPVHRKDNYVLAQLNKLKDIRILIDEYNVHSVICAGDVFDKPVVSIPWLMTVSVCLEQWKVPVYTTPGNHDLYNYSLDTYYRTSLMLLEKLVPNLEVCTSNTGIIGPEGVNLEFQEHSADVDTNRLNAYSMNNLLGNHVNIKTAHGMLLDHKPPVEPYTLLDNLDTHADVLITGHDHKGYGVVKVNDTLCINLGSIMRSASNEVDRRPRVGILDTETLEVEVINLKSAEPGLTVFDMESVKDKKERDEYVSNFKELVDGLDTDVSLSNSDLLKSVANQIESKHDVVDVCLQRLEQQQLGGLDND